MRDTTSIQTVQLHWLGIQGQQVQLQNNEHKYLHWPIAYSACNTASWGGRNIEHKMEGERLDRRIGESRNGQGSRRRSKSVNPLFSSTVINVQILKLWRKMAYKPNWLIWGVNYATLRDIYTVFRAKKKRLSRDLHLQWPSESSAQHRFQRPITRTQRRYMRKIWT